MRGCCWTCARLPEPITPSALYRPPRPHLMPRRTTKPCGTRCSGAWVARRPMVSRMRGMSRASRLPWAAWGCAPLRAFLQRPIGRGGQTRSPSYRRAGPASRKRGSPSSAPQRTGPVRLACGRRRRPEHSCKQKVGLLFHLGRTCWRARAPSTTTRL